MFSEKLEKLIQASIQDGVLTDQEKSAIIRRANAEGEDIDEVEIYIDSLLQKRQKELNNSTTVVKKASSNKEELKKLIDAALTDGVVTTKERTAIFNKARTLGIDAAEVEIYLDAEIQKAEQAADAVKREKIGEVCPQCGKQVPPLTLKCDCGYEFKSNKSTSSIQLLSDKLNNIQLTDDEIDSCSDVVEEKVGFDNYKAIKDEKGNVVKKLNEEKANKLKEQKKIDIIQSFPVPNTKEDIIEFLAISVASANKEISFLEKKKNFFIIVLIAGIIIPVAGWIFGFIIMDDKSFIEEKLKNAWHAKCEQVLIKGRSLRGDAEFTQQLNYYENLLNKK